MIEKRFNATGVKIYHGDKSDPDNWLASYEYYNGGWTTWTGATSNVRFDTEQEAREYAITMAMKLRMTR